jgi:hypothetical protein
MKRPYLTQDERFHVRNGDIIGAFCEFDLAKKKFRRSVLRKLEWINKLIERL